jgi:hypothetical protein
MDHKPQAAPAGATDAASVPAAEAAPIGAADSAAVAASRGLGRRALLRGGVAAAPVLLSLHSGPVAASGNMACTVASSFVSVATFASRNPGATTLQCSSMNAHHWHQSAKAVEKMAVDKRPAWARRKLVAYLGQTCSMQAALHPTQPADYEVWQVMGLGEAPATVGELGVLHHILGLALSIDQGRGVVNTGGRVNTPYLASIWQNYKSSGGYRLPAGHVNWSEAELISWLKMLQYPVPLPQA